MPEDKKIVKKRYKRHVNLGRALEFRPAKFPKGATGDHPAVRGEYSHVYETNNGLHGHEVWLCCVPIDELLSDRFQCSGSTLLPGLWDEDYQKVRYCSLEHPTSDEPTFIPVCIPAPLTHEDDPD